MARRRRYAQAKLTTIIAKNHGVIAMEDLRIKNMTASSRGTVEKPGKNVKQKAGLNRSILDLAPGALRVRLGMKLARSVGMLVLVPAAHTSQRCNPCGNVEKGNRRTRGPFRCLKRGHEADADDNAAANARPRTRPVGRARIGPDRQQPAHAAHAAGKTEARLQARCPRLCIAGPAGGAGQRERSRWAGGRPASACTRAERQRSAGRTAEAAYRSGLSGKPGPVNGVQVRA